MLQQYEIRGSMRRSIEYNYFNFAKVEISKKNCVQKAKLMKIKKKQAEHVLNEKFGVSEKSCGVGNEQNNGISQVMKYLNKSCKL